MLISNDNRIHNTIDDGTHNNLLHTERPTLGNYRTTYFLNIQSG